MDLSNVKRDPERVDGGEWVDDIPNMDDLRLRVRGLTSPLVMALRSRRERKISREGRERDGSLKHAVAVDVLGAVLFEVVLLDWDKLTLDGKVVPYDKDMAKRLCTERQFMPFQDAVVWAANYVDRGQGDVRETYAGNLQTPSDGGSTAAQSPETTETAKT